VNCPECDAIIDVPVDVIQGEIISCKDCGTSYELTKAKDASAFSIKPAELEEEDWGE
jgi:alpha-aminoadipate carrier protein LysW